MQKYGLTKSWQAHAELIQIICESLLLSWKQSAWKSCENKFVLNLTKVLNEYPLSMTLWVILPCPTTTCLPICFNSWSNILHLIQVIKCSTWTRLTCRLQEWYYTNYWNIYLFSGRFLLHTRNNWVSILHLYRNYLAVR